MPDHDSHIGAMRAAVLVFALDVLLIVAGAAYLLAEVAK